MSYKVQISYAGAGSNGTGSTYIGYINGRFALQMDIEARDERGELQTAARVMRRRFPVETDGLSRLTKAHELADHDGRFAWRLAR